MVQIDAEAKQDKEVKEVKDKGKLFITIIIIII
jgi:hypothetical protein